jgi:cysteine-rich repeat protein
MSRLAIVAVLLFAVAAAAAVCGDGTRQGSEQCDRTDVGGLGCENLCFDGGLLRCTAACTFDTAACTVCGNDRREPGEACDGADLGGWWCPEGGVAACYPDCSDVDQRGCFRCGNGVKEGQEQCDLPDVGGATCDQPGETGGFVSCTVGGLAAGGCRYDRTTCWRCGNGRLEGDEECDDGNVASGDGCSDTCRSECGDGVVQAAGEQCDDGNRTDGDGCSQFCLVENLYAGGGGEAVDSCSAVWGIGGVPPAATVTCRNGDPRCDRGTSADGCRLQYYLCVNRNPTRVPPPCFPTAVSRLELEPASTLGDADRGAFLDMATELLGRAGGTVTRDDALATVRVAPPLTRRGECGEASLTVPVGTDRVLRAATTDADLPAATDHDEIVFRCTP